jgi:hypothetical protein
VTKAPTNVAASVLARLRNVAQKASLSFNDILQSYAIERFFSRLSPAALTAKFHSEPVHVRQWAAFVRRIGEPALANEFARVLADVLADLAEFLMPVSKAAATSVEYPPAPSKWRPTSA